MDAQIDKVGSNKFFERLASKLIEIIVPTLKNTLEKINTDEELLTRKEVAERIFKCDVKTFDKFYRYAPGFPKITKEGSEKYPKKLVEKWIHENTQY